MDSNGNFNLDKLGDLVGDSDDENHANQVSMKQVVISEEEEEVYYSTALPGEIIPLTIEGET